MTSSKRRARRLRSCSPGHGVRSRPAPGGRSNGSASKAARSRAYRCAQWALRARLTSRAARFRQASKRSTLWSNGPVTRRWRGCSLSQKRRPISRTLSPSAAFQPWVQRSLTTPGFFSCGSKTKCARRSSTAAATTSAPVFGAAASSRRARTPRSSRASRPLSNGANRSTFPTGATTSFCSSSCRGAARTPLTDRNTRTLWPRSWSRGMAAAPTAPSRVAAARTPGCWPTPWRGGRPSARPPRRAAEEDRCQGLEGDSGAEAVRQVEHSHPNLIPREVTLPDGSGFDVCRELRKMDPAVPVIMMSSRSDEIDVVVALEIGADDYVSKPLRLRELVARMTAHLRRTRFESAEEMRSRTWFRDTVLDVNERRTYKSGKEVELTHTEFDLLTFLASNAGKVLSREKILNSIWGYEYPIETRVIDVRIRNLRRKIETQPSRPYYILPVPGTAYPFTTPPPA